MKKLLVSILAIIMALSVCACGDANDQTDIATLYNEGYTVEIIGTSEYTLGIVFNKDDSHIKVTSELSEMQLQQYQDLDVFNDDYDGLLQMFLISVVDVKTEDISGLVPEQAELDKYVGKTIGDLEAEGLLQTYSCITENEATFGYSNGVYVMDLAADGYENVTDFGDIPDSVIEQFVVTDAKFSEFSYDILFD